MMSLKTLRTIALFTLAALSAFSCQKGSEETTTLPSLKGSVSIVGVEEFMDASTEASRTLKLKPANAVHPEGKELGYCWKVTPFMEKFDTTRYATGLDKNGKPSDGSFEYVLADSLGTFTIYCYAFAPGYSSTYSIAYTTLVKSGPEGSITNADTQGNAGEVGFNHYYYVTIGNRDWINMNAYQEEGLGMPFRNAEPMSQIFGRYYNYEDAKAACASIGEEWSLPTEEDWLDVVRVLTNGNEKAPEIKKYSNIYWDKAVNGTPTLASQLMVNASFNTEQMWTYYPAVGDPVNTSGLSLLPTGYANLGITPTVRSASNYPDAMFEGLYDYAVFWTADEVEGEEGMAYYRYIMGNKPHLMIGKGNKETFGASVRCVRNSY